MKTNLELTIQLRMELPEAGIPNPLRDHLERLLYEHQDLLAVYVKMELLLLDWNAWKETFYQQDGGDLTDQVASILDTIAPEVFHLSGMDIPTFAQIEAAFSPNITPRGVVFSWEVEQEDEATHHP